MTEVLVPRRSVLYMPGANARALEKAKDIPADSLIFDLEDAVAPDAKEAARERVCAAAASGDYGLKEIIIRVNGLDTPWCEGDLRAASQSGASAVLVPKINSAADIAVIEERLREYSAPDTLGIWAMLETPSGIFNVRSIAASSTGLTTFVMGTNDIAKELHAEYVADRSPLLFSLSTCLLAVREAGKVILDGVFNDIADAEGFLNEARQGRSMGFDGKTLIHPAQVDPCNDIFAPSAKEVDFASRVIEAFETAQAEGLGVVTVDGRMIENLHVDNARRSLALATAIAERSRS
ncbi:MAG: CoA ester lyase [Actinomycetota bacterium]